MPRGRITIKRTVRWQYRVRATVTQRYVPMPSIAPTRSVTQQLPPVSSRTTRRIISRPDGGGSIGDLYVAPPSPDKTWDVFVSYASEDKAGFVADLVGELRALAIEPWFDETELIVGMGLRRSIDYGLANSRFGIVVMSHSFFAKEWPQRELDGLVALQVAGRQRVLPVWHGITHDDVLRYSPTLADTIAARSPESSVKEIAEEIAQAIRGAE